MTDPILALFHLYFTFLIYIFLGSFFFITLWIYLTNPFRKLTIVRSVFSSALIKDTIFLFKNGEVSVHTNYLWRAFGWIKSGAHIAKNAFFAAPKARGKTVEEIIERIHRLRFNPSKPFMISGDHFSIFYPRNLGIFYYPVLDPRVALSEKDWLDREKKYLQTTAYALEIFTKANYLSTTIVPLGRRAVTLIQVFAYPSDTLYGILHALNVMQSSSEFKKLFPFETKKEYTLHTKESADELLEAYSDGLKKLYKGYRKKVFDERSGLIRKSIRLSSTLDMKIRSSSFYDNVIFWKTTKLAGELGIIGHDREFLKELKERIIQTFWYEEGGYFLDDLSSEGLEHKAYASDWYIMLMTGFLSPLRKSEVEYFTRSVAFVRENKLDKPFPLKVMGAVSDKKNHGIVKTFVPNYQVGAIWSNCGQQYMKILAVLYAATGDKSYLADAKAGVKAYRENILKYKGYPELYDSEGNMLQNFFYRSIRQTGWVVDFEHTQALVKYYASTS